MINQLFFIVCQAKFTQARELDAKMVFGDEGEQDLTD